MRAAKDIFIVAAKRTAIGSFAQEGFFAQLADTTIAAAVAKDALETLPITPDKVEAVICGNVCPTFNYSSATLIRDNLNIPSQIPAYTINRQSGSGLQAIFSGLQEIELSRKKLVLCIGFEIFNRRIGVAPNDRNQDVCEAENLGRFYKFSKEDCDNYAIKSARRYEIACSQQVFKDEIIDFIPAPSSPKIVNVDQHAIWNSSPVIRTKMAFLENGVLSANNSARPADGAAAVVLADEETIQQNNWRPLAKISAYTTIGENLTKYNFGASRAISHLVHETNKQLKDIDLYEIHEENAPAVLSVIEQLRLDEKKVNVHGGAIGLGNPRGMSGARMIVHLSYMLRNMKTKDPTRTASAVASIGVFHGQSIAVMLESV